MHIACPLFLQTMAVINDAPPGRRNAEFDDVIPQMGLMHCSMIMLSAAKTIAFDAVLDGLIKDTGESSYAQSRLRESKDFKSNLLFVCESICALAIRIVEELIMDGSLDFADDPFFGKCTRKSV